MKSSIGWLLLCTSTLVACAAANAPVPTPPAAQSVEPKVAEAAPTPPKTAPTPAPTKPAPAPASKPAASPVTTPKPSTAAAPASKPAAAPKVATSAPPPAAAAVAPQAAKPAALDLKTLEQRLKQTGAIGVLTKLSLKNQVDDLVSKFRTYHAGARPPTLPELRPAFELLLMKALSLLQDKDPTLAREIDASRDAIWSVLSDRDKFSQYTS